MSVGYIEEPASVSARGLRLFGMLHRPHGAEQRRACFVFCSPLAEEKKCAHRVFVNAARQMAAQGFHSLRFDFSGTADSEGEPAQTALTAWRQDLGSAVDYARRQTGCQRLGLLGLRLGASIAALEAPELPDLSWLVLWEPVISGRDYLRMNLRRSLIRQAMIQRDDAGTQVTRRPADQATTAPGPAPWSPGQLVAWSPPFTDFDGHHLPSCLLEELAQVDLLHTAPAHAPALLLNITPREALTKPCQQLVEVYREAGSRLEPLTIREQPFWNLIGLVEGPRTVQATLDWLLRNC